MPEYCGLQAFQYAFPRLVLFCVLSVVSCGVLPVACRWRPDWMTRLARRRTRSFRDADVLLLETRRRRLVESQLIVDESWALAGRGGRFEYPVLIGVGLTFYVLWVGGTVLGTVVGDLFDPEAIGLDAAFPALFLALLAPYLRRRRALIVALVAAAITLVLLPVAPPGVPIVAASLACLIGLRR